MRTTSLILFLGMQLAALPVLGQHEPTIPSLSNDQIARLNRGEILVDVIEGAIPVGDAIGVIEAPPATVMAILDDFSRHAEVFSDVVLSEVVGQEGEFEIQHGITDTPWPMADREWTIRAWSGPREVDGVPTLVATWEYVPGSGNIVDTVGYYLLIPWGEDGSKTLLRYHIMVDLGTWLPGFLLEWSTETMLPEQILALRNQL